MSRSDSSAASSSDWPLPATPAMPRISPARMSKLIPFSRSTGRYMFEEIGVIANDFGDEFAEELTKQIEATVDAIVGG